MTDAYAGTVRRVVAQDLCIGCGLCVFVCKEHALRMRWTADCVWQPEHSSDACTNCGECARVCPGSPATITECAQRAASAGARFGLAEGARSFVAWDADHERRIRSASGGVVTALLSELLLAGRVDAALVAIARETSAGQPHYVARVVRSPAELESSRSSCYGPVRYDEALAELRRTGESFAVTALPCLVRGMNRLREDLRAHVRYTIGIVCSHNVTGAFTDCLARINGIKGDEPFRVNLRDKFGGIPDANNYNTYFGSAHGEVRRNRFASGFTEMWRGHFFAQNPCFYCPDFYGADADISVKDAWGRLSIDPLGKSLCVVRNTNLVASLERMAGDERIRLEECEADEVLRSQAITAQFKHVQVLQRLVWHPALRRELARRGCPAGAARRWWRPHTWEFAALHCMMRLSRRQWRDRGRVSVQGILAVGRIVGASAVLVRSGGALVRRLLGVARRVGPAFWRLGRRARGAVIFRPGRLADAKLRGRLRVLVAGGYGYGNTGDEAQLAANLEHWRRLAPEAEVIVLSPNPEYTARAHNVRAEPASRVAFFDAGRRGDYNASNERFKRDFRRMRGRLLWNARLLSRGLPLVGVTAEQARLLRLLQTADVLYLSGGGYLTGSTLSRLWDHMLLIRLGDLLGVPAILSGQTIGVFQDRESVRLARRGLARAGLIYLRDHGRSVQDLAAIGVAGDHVQQTFDDALFCAQAPPEALAAALREQGVDAACPYAAVHLHDWGLDRAQAKRVVHRFARLADWLVEQCALPVLFVPMMSLDEPAQRACLEAMRTHATMLQYDYDYRLARAAVGGATLCLTMKHHPIVFAMANGVPALAVALDDYYYHKNAGALGLCGLARYALSADDFFGPEAERALKEALANTDQIRAAMLRWVEECRPRAGEAITRFLSMRPGRAGREGRSAAQGPGLPLSERT